MSNFICAIHIDTEYKGISIDVLESKSILDMYDAIYKHIKNILDIHEPLLCCLSSEGAKKDLESWIQRVCNTQTFCNISYKIQFTEEGFICKEN